MTPTVFVFERLAALIHQLVRDDAARHGLLPVHMQVLGYLAQANRYSDLSIAVADYLGITRGTVSQTLAVLERKGLITRTPDDRHGKRIHLTLSAAGEAVLNASWSQRLDQALATAGGDAQAFGNDLRGVLSALQRLNGKQAFGQCRQCAHFLGEDGDYRCGLTGEALAVEQTIKICREWTSPDTRMSAAGRLSTHR
ncbi:MAG: MarR family transcriptional regulator [Candidatus Accumulibacter phosphatis]|uniref:MarR family winged helix-turn-helix transcriptional regulator n=1 Tax=Candidatus Accumulibacter phosphatis TaxID=327160 RepID=UPI001A5AC1F0|nr:MarR family transcriptional regulator [Candidatus Accumulibacter phosphatis]